jgi:hypothetical protein
VAKKRKSRAVFEALLEHHLEDFEKARSIAHIDLASFSYEDMHEIIHEAPRAMLVDLWIKFGDRINAAGTYLDAWRRCP